MSLSWMRCRNGLVHYLLDRGVHTGVRVALCRPTPARARYEVRVDGVQSKRHATLKAAKEAAASRYLALKETPG